MKTFVFVLSALYAFNGLALAQPNVVKLTASDGGTALAA